MMKKYILAATILLTASAAFAQSKLDTLVEAFAYVESRNNTSAVSDDCVGYLQITPICVKEANRILGYECFYDFDRYDKQGSIAIFKVIMRHYNKECDLRKACNVWNPRGGKSYYASVKAAYDKLKKN